MFLRVWSVIQEIIKFKAVFIQLVLQQLILRYRRTFFGYLWTLFNPLLMITVMVVVFSTLFKVDMKTFAVFLFSGMIPWNCFSLIVGQSTGVFITNENLIKKIYIPKILFPFSISISLLVESTLSFLAFFIIILCLGADFSWSILFLPVAYLLLFIFSFGIGLIASVTTVFFRDLQHVIVIMLQGLFYLTPILYNKSALAGKISLLIYINPVAPFIELFRAPLNGGILPSSSTIIHATILAFLSLFIGIVVFLRNEYKIVFRL